MEGVFRPKEDATDPARRTEGGAMGIAVILVDATKTPHFGGHEKYATLRNKESGFNRTPNERMLTRQRSRRSSPSPRIVRSVRRPPSGLVCRLSLPGSAESLRG